MTDKAESASKSPDKIERERGRTLERLYSRWTAEPGPEVAGYIPASVEDLQAFIKTGTIQGSLWKYKKESKEKGDIFLTVLYSKMPGSWLTRQFENKKDSVESAEETEEHALGIAQTYARFHDRADFMMAKLSIPRNDRRAHSAFFSMAAQFDDGDRPVDLGGLRWDAYDEQLLSKYGREAVTDLLEEARDSRDGVILRVKASAIMAYSIDNIEPDFPNITLRTGARGFDIKHVDAIQAKGVDDVRFFVNLRT